MHRLLRATIVLATIVVSIRISEAASTDTKGDLIGSYEIISSALAADDLASAKAAGEALAHRTEVTSNPAFLKSAESIATAANIDDARHGLWDLTTLLEPIVADRKDTWVMYCPMTQLDWIQAPGKTQNPYLGQAMPHCGKRKKSS